MKNITAKLHIKANTDAVEFIGEVKAKNVKDLKEAARKHARSWNKHLYGRIHMQLEDGREFQINP